MYDKNNVFAKILRGEIPTRFIVENDHAVSFYDITPASESHALVIPRGEYRDMLEFVKSASDVEQSAFWQCFSDTVDALGIKDDCNIWSNVGANAPYIKQSVFHFHLHIVGGKRVGNMPEGLL